MTSLFGRMATTQTCRCRVFFLLLFFAVHVFAEDNKLESPGKSARVRKSGHRSDTDTSDGGVHRSAASTEETWRAYIAAGINSQCSIMFEVCYFIRGSDAHGCLPSTCLTAPRALVMSQPKEDDVLVRHRARFELNRQGTIYSVSQIPEVGRRNKRSVLVDTQIQVSAT